MIHDKVTRRGFVSAAIAVPLVTAAGNKQWTELFDGRSLNGWRASEHKDSWKVVDGRLAADGPRSHLFYVGALREANFRNFELEVELTTKPECNSGIYFHTAYQETGFPEKGFEVQINNTARGDGGYMERKKTGSLYGLRNMYKQLVPDERPFHVHVIVRGKNVKILLDGELLVDYVEPTPPVIPAGGEKQRYLDRGTFALQCHNDGSKAFYRSVRVRPLPDDLPAYVGQAPVVDDVYRQIIDIGRHNVPMVDYDVFLRKGLTLEQALAKSRQDGIQYGLIGESAVLRSDEGAERWLRPLTGRPVFCGLSASDPSWTRALSRDTAQKFDYIALRAASGKEGSLDPEQLVAETIGRLDSEPVDLYAHPSRVAATKEVPAGEIWTQDRATKLIEALLRNKVAIELNTIQQLPSESFIRQAKDAGCKFAFGTANSTAADLGRCEYGLRMFESCGLDWHNFFAPGAWWPKAVERRWPTSG